jgi:hypothetical protein
MAQGTGRRVQGGEGDSKAVGWRLEGGGIEHRAWSIEMKFRIADCELKRKNPEFRIQNPGVRRDKISDLGLRGAE